MCAFFPSKAFCFCYLFKLEKVPNSGDFGKNQRHMKKEGFNDTIVDGVCSEKNKVKKGEKLSLHDNYDEPGMYEEFRPIWGPGSKYKPWING